MNSAPITSPAIAGGSQLTLSWSVTITVKANLNRLSFAAPENCVQKNGAKRRCFYRANWLGCSGSSAAVVVVTMAGCVEVLFISASL